MPFAWLAVAALGGAYFGAQGDDALEGKTGGSMGFAVLGLAAFGAYALWQKVK